MRSDPGSATTAGERAAPLALRLLGPVFEGGAEGQRRAVLLIISVLGPVSIAVTTALAEHARPWMVAARCAGLGVGVGWIALRPRPTRAEWFGVVTVIALTNAGGQVMGGVSHNGVSALNSLVSFVVVAIVFDTATVVYAGALLAVVYAAVQLHVGSPADAAAAEVLYVLALLVLGAIVHGTALYLRESIRRGAELHAAMERTAERERARIAGELHDDTIQVMTAAGVKLDALVRQLDHEAPGAAGGVAQVRGLLTDALDRARKLTFELYPPHLEQRGLELALRTLAERVARESGMAVDVSVDADDLPQPETELAYRTVKELLTNARKHADATRVRVEVTATNGVMAGRVEDDGRGFDERAVARARSEFHLGLDATRDRLRAAGGRLEIDSAPGRGARVSFTVPVRRSDRSRGRLPDEP